MNQFSRVRRSHVRPAPLRMMAEALERLEARTLMDAVFWDGGAGTSNWSDAANWSRNGVDALPQSGDDVTISVGANPTIAYTGGSVLLASLMSNEAITVSGGTLGLSGAAAMNGVLTVSGGTIQGGTWDVTGGQVTLGTVNTSTLSDVTLRGDLTLGTGARGRIANGLVFVDPAGRIRFTGGGGQQLGFLGGGVLASGGVSFESTAGTSELGVVGNGTLVVGAGVSVSGGRARIGGNLFGAANTGVTIQGSVLATGPLTLTSGGSGGIAIASGGSVGASGSGATLNIDSNSAAWSSAGVISASAGAVVTLSDAWTSTGALTVNAATLNLGGSFATSSLAGLSRTGAGAAVAITGTLNNEGQTFTLTGATGDILLSGGSILGGAAGGAIRQDGGVLLFASSNSNTLDRQTIVTGDLRLADNASLRIVNGVSFAAAATQRIRFSGSGNSNLGFTGGGVVPVSVVFESTAGTDDLGVTGNGVLVIPAGVTVSGARGRLGQSQFGAGSSGLTNLGSIVADASGQSIAVVTGGSGVFTNGSGGVLRATGGGALTVDVNAGAWSSSGSMIVEASSTLTLADAWSSTGSIGVSGGTLNLGGSFSYSSVANGFSRAGGTVNITGAMDNQGQTLALNAQTGDWVLNGGTITGGAAGGGIAQDGSFLLFTSSTASALDRQTFMSGDLVLGGGQALRIVNGIGFAALSAQRIRFTGAGGQRLGFVGDSTLMADVSFEATSGVSEIGNVGDGVLTIPEGVRLVGGRGTIGAFVFTNGDTGVINRGAVLANVAGTGITLDGSGTGVVESTGSLRAMNGASMIANRLAGDLAGVAVEGAGSNAVLNGSFVLRGVLAPVAGTTISINASAPGTAWTSGSGGGFDVQGGTLNLGGAFGVQSVANFSRAGGSVNLVGVLNNASQTFTLSSATGSWHVSGGAISGGAAGGTIRFSGGHSLTFSNSTANTLERQTIDGDIVLGTGAALRVVSGATFSSNVFRFRLAGAGGNRLGFVGNTVLATGGISFENTSGTSDAGPVGNATLTINPGVVVSGGRGRFGLTQFGGGNGNIINAGLIAADVSGQTLAVQASGAGTVTSTGTLSAAMGGTLAVSDVVGEFNNVSATGAGSVVNLVGEPSVLGRISAASAGTVSINPGNATTAWALDSIGALDVRGGTVNLGGRFTLAGDATFVRSGGAVNITGVFDNEGAVFELSARTGSFNLGGGVITGGAGGGGLRFTQGAGLTFNVNNANTLDRQTIDGDIVVGSGGNLRIVNGVTFVSSSNRIRLGGTGGNAVAFVGSATLSTGGVVFEASSGLSDVGIVGNGTLTIGAGVTISGGRGRLGQSLFTLGTTSVINAGVIQADANGQGILVDTSGAPGGSFSNLGVVRAVGGGRFTVAADTPITNVAAGVLSGGAWLASGASVIVLTNVTITTNNADVGVGAASSFPALLGLAVNNGSLRVAGTYNITPTGGTLTNHGVVTLGPSGALAITGSIVLGAAGVLDLEVQGTGAGDIGLLSVSGSAVLGGTLRSTPVSGFEGECLMSRFMSAGAIVGSFGEERLFVPAGRHQSFTLIEGGEMRLVISPLADFNRDGALNAQDLFDFLNGMFNNDADYNGDGVTNTADYFLFLADFFRGCP